MRKYLWWLVAVLATASFAPLQAQGPSLLWKISGNGLEQPSYLFGTYHLLGQGYLPEVPGAKKALASSQAVVVEMILDSGQLGQMQQMSLMKDSTLSQLLDSAQYAMVGAELKQTLGYEIAQVERLKPVVLAAALALAYHKEFDDVLKPYAGTPLDIYIAEEGKRKGKEVIPLETMMQQAEILYNGQSLKTQAAGLVEMVENKEHAMDISGRLVETYLAQNLDALWVTAESSPDTWGSMPKLLDQRNSAWMEELTGLIQKQSTFIAVGALHLAGDKGLIMMMQQRGYTVTPVN